MEGKAQEPVYANEYYHQDQFAGLFFQIRFAVQLQGY